MNSSFRTLEPHAWIGVDRGLDVSPLSPSLSPLQGERTPRHSDALCIPEPQVGPLTPALSPSEGERGNRRQLSGEPRFRGRGNCRRGDWSGVALGFIPSSAPLITGLSAARLLRCRSLAHLAQAHRETAPESGARRNYWPGWPAWRTGNRARRRFASRRLWQGR